MSEFEKMARTKCCGVPLKKIVDKSPEANKKAAVPYTYICSICKRDYKDGGVSFKHL